ncbi:helix-turn-helix domain-containing protein [Bradyrhizobium sp. 23AC]
MIEPQQAKPHLPVGRPFNALTTDDQSAKGRARRKRRMSGAYLGDPDKANRLQAARKQAGFRSGRAAALHFGWSAATYCAHETATRFLHDETANIYASAFKVNAQWLLRGIGEGPAVDPVRATQFRNKIERKAEQAKNDPAASSCRRLRLARRLAGFRSTTDAARATGLMRTTLSAHETGQNSISDKMARLYAEAFRVSPEWLRTGALPSGYPPEIERQLPSVVDTYGESDKVAMANLSPLLPVVGLTSETRKVAPPVRSLAPRPLKADMVPEIAGRHLFRGLESGSLADAPQEHIWSLPHRYVAEVLGGLLPATIIVAPGSEVEGLNRADRVIVDTSARTAVAGETFVLVDRNGHFVLIKPQAGQPLDPPDSRWKVLGKKIGRVTSR